jgi:Arc/MetJ-type ribon-helix-helix transcriptional regulator
MWMSFTSFSHPNASVFDGDRLAYPLFFDILIIWRIVLSKVFVETSVHLMEGIDEMVKEGYYSSRSEAVNEAISLLLKQYKISKLYAKDAKNRRGTGNSYKK